MAMEAHEFHVLMAKRAGAEAGSRLRLIWMNIVKLGDRL
jgi:hypothetical protein